MSKKYPPQSGTPDKSDPDFMGLRQFHHEPVLLEQVLAALDPKPGETYLDLTAGYGGHAAAVIRKIGKPSLATLVDRDETAMARIEQQFAGARLMHQDFAASALALSKEGNTYDTVLVDLGVSSPQLDDPARGFSFQSDAPLDMRMDRRDGTTAEDLVNTLPARELERIIRSLGEERPGAAKRIARAITAARPIESTGALARIITRQYRGDWARTHPATRTFQALRLSVNDELGQLQATLPLLPGLLRPGGRLAVISFHSLEDRLVKQFLRERSQGSYEATLKVLTKKPISGATHDTNNPRARSAQLRAAVKTNIYPHKL